MNVKEHYDKHLGNFYSWMIGDFAQKQAEQEKFFIQHSIKPFKTNIAFDLGAAHGLQSISLANIGFSVKAVDFNTQLLEELSVHRKNLPVEIILADMCTFLEGERTAADVIDCMGDTITHLSSIDEVVRIIQLSAEHLITGGKLVLSYRDLSRPLVGEQRFIPVKQDANRILTCFLEYFADHVIVHDILHEKQNDQWVQKVSAYPKLIIEQQTMVSLLEKHGFKTNSIETVNRMLHIVAEKN